MTRPSRLGALLAVAGLCLVLAVGGAAVVDATDHRDDNQTQHEHPDEVGDEGDLAAVEDWLAGRMTEIHLDCAEALSTAESAACDRLDEEYPEYLEQYADVERDRTGDNDTAETFEETREDQQELAEETREFWDTYDEYQEARAEGDTAERRRLARDLTESSERIEALSDELNLLFARLEDRTGREYGGAQRSTNDTAMAVLRTTAGVQETEFTPSSLTASVDDTEASFRDPVVVSGRLTAENGTALADRTVSVTVDDRTVATVETDEDGRYEATYRPVTTTTGETTIRVWYEPTGVDPFLGSNGSDTVDVEAVDPSVVVDVDDDRVAFGDTIPVTIEVSVLGVSAADVPVRVFFGGERIAAGRTGPDGEVLLGGSVPATVPAGDATLTVRASREGTALTPTDERTQLTVEPSETNLTVEGLLDGDELVLSGQLTSNGRPVAGQRVGVNVDGEVREMARTDGQGRYEVRVPRETGGRGAWSVTADYENPRTNLGPSTTTKQITADEVEATTGTDTSTTLFGKLRQLASNSEYLRSLSDGELLAVVGAGLLALVLAVGGVGVVLRRRLGDDGPGPVDDGIVPTVVDVPEDGGSAETAETSTPGPPDDAPSETLEGPAALDVARARLGDDPNEAVKIGYGAVRRALSTADDPGDGDPRTHWEFYRDAETALPADRAEALERLTEAYQHAEFAPDGTDPSAARAALDAAETCLTPSTDGRPTDLV